MQRGVTNMEEYRRFCSMSIVAMASGSENRSDESDRSEEDIKAYALNIGIDPENEPELLWIAKEAIFARLPPGWAESKDENGKPVFHNRYLQTSTNEHPCKAQYSHLVAQERERMQRMTAVGSSVSQPDKKENEEANNAQAGPFRSGFLNVISTKNDETTSITLISFDDEDDGGNLVKKLSADFPIFDNSVSCDSQLETDEKEGEDDETEAAKGPDKSGHDSSGKREHIRFTPAVRFLEAQEDQEKEEPIKRSEGSFHSGFLSVLGKEQDESYFSPTSNDDEDSAISEKLDSGSSDAALQDKYQSVDQSTYLEQEFIGEALYSSGSDRLLDRDVKEEDEADVEKSLDEFQFGFGPISPETPSSSSSIGASGAGKDKQAEESNKTCVEVELPSEFRFSDDYVRCERQLLRDINEWEDEKNEAIKSQDESGYNSPARDIRGTHMDAHFEEQRSESSQQQALFGPPSMYLAPGSTSCVPKRPNLLFLSGQSLDLVSSNGFVAMDVKGKEGEEETETTTSQDESVSESTGEDVHSRPVEELQEHFHRNTVSDLGAEQIESLATHSLAFVDCKIYAGRDSRHVMQIKDREDNEKTVASKSTETAGYSGAKLVDKQTKTHTDSAKAIRDGDVVDEITELEAQSEDQSSESSRQETSEEGLEIGDSVSETETSSKSQDESVNDSVEDVDNHMVAQVAQLREKTLAPFNKEEDEVKQLRHDQEIRICRQKEELVKQEKEEILQLMKEKETRICRRKIELRREEEEELEQLKRAKEMRLHELRKGEEEEEERLKREMDIRKCCLREELNRAEKEAKQSMREKQMRMQLWKEEEEEEEQLKREKARRMCQQKEALIKEEEEEVTQFKKEIERKILLFSKTLMRKEEEEAKQLKREKELRVQLHMEELQREEEEEGEILKREKNGRFYLRQEQQMREKEEEQAKLKKHIEMTKHFLEEEFCREEDDAERRKRERLTITHLRQPDDQLARERRTRLHHEEPRREEENARLIREKDLRKNSLLMDQLSREEEEELTRLRRDKEMRLRAYREGLKKEEEDEVESVKKKQMRRIYLHQKQLRREEEEEVGQLQRERQRRLRVCQEGKKRKEASDVDQLKRESTVRINLQEFSSDEKEAERFNREKVKSWPRRKAQRLMGKIKGLFMRENDTQTQLQGDELRSEDEDVESSSVEEENKRQRIERGTKTQLHQKGRMSSIEEEGEVFMWKNDTHLQQELSREDEKEMDYLKREKQRKISLFNEELKREVKEEVEQLQREREKRMRNYKKKLRRDEEIEAKRLKRAKEQRIHLLREELKAEEEEEAGRLKRDKEKRMSLLHEELQKDEEQLKSENEKSLLQQEEQSKNEEEEHFRREEEKRTRHSKEKLRKEEEEEVEQFKGEKERRMHQCQEELKREEADEAERLKTEKENRMGRFQDLMKRETDEFIDKSKAEKQKRMRLRQIDLWGEEERRKLKTEYKERLKVLRQCLLVKRRYEENLLKKKFEQKEKLAESTRMERDEETFQLGQDYDTTIRSLCLTLEEEREAEHQRLKAQRRQFFERLKPESTDELVMPTTSRAELNFFTPEQAHETTLDMGSCSTFHPLNGAAPECQHQIFGPTLAELHATTIMPTFTATQGEIYPASPPDVFWQQLRRTDVEITVYHDKMHNKLFL
ncbi:uncharacterized protein LOC144033840 isoform X4 [Festucalex cinctus]